MAHGFLQSFDNSNTICSAGTDPAKIVNPLAIFVMQEAGIDISDHIPTNVDIYLDSEWDYVITVCDHANETCPSFSGKVTNRIHLGFEDPSHKSGSPEYILSEFRRVRDQIKERFMNFYQDSL
jgi:arsenate reductase